MNIFKFFKKNVPDIAIDTRIKHDVKSRPKVLVLSSSKQNQNYYRDYELIRQSQGVFLTEKFNFEQYDWDIGRLVNDYFDDPIDLIFINYVQAYTSKLIGFESINAKIIGFVGDHYNFIDDTKNALQKQDFFKGLKLSAMATAYPNTNNIVAEALQQPNLPFIHLPWAIDPSVFHNLGNKRKFDIACMGAMTEGKYPLRRKVRFWLEKQSAIRLLKKKRVKGRNGTDHDGESFNKALNSCKAAFTCCSSMKYTLMKYFEIPASGALLFAEETEDLSGLGYIDGVNYIQVSEDNFSEKFEYYFLGDGRQSFEKIRKAGYELAITKNTWENRISAFLEDVEKL